MWFGYTDPHLVPHNVKAAMADAPENLRFPGFLSRQSCARPTAGGRFLFCSYEETEGIVILEALACSTPTLVQDIPAYRGWLRDSVNVHTYRTTQDLPTRLQALLQHKLPDTAAAARQTAEERALPVLEHNYWNYIKHYRSFFRPGTASIRLLRVLYLSKPAARATCAMVYDIKCANVE